MVWAREAGGIPTSGLGRSEVAVCRGDIVMDVACDMEAGLSIRQVADRRHLPVDFIVMAISRAQERGLLQVADLTSRSTCGETTCQPDPSSLICAGCLFRPRADA